MDALTRVRVGADLERLRHTGDVAAKQLVEKHIESCGTTDHGAWFKSLGDGDASAPIEEFLSASGDGEADELSAVIDIEQVRHAQRFFETYGLHISAGLLLNSLPTSYACARGAQVLYLTSELMSDPARRIRETAQMLILMLSPDPTISAKDRTTTTTLHAGGQGARAARRIRLFHAVVRHLFATEKALINRWKAREDKFGQHGQPALGVPLCQEDQLGTLFTFSVSVFQSLEKLGVPVGADDRTAWFHVWDVIGRHLGVGVESALPEEAEGEAKGKAKGEADKKGRSHVQRSHTDPIFCSSLTAEMSTELMSVILDRHQEESHEGKILTNALLQEVQGPLPRALKPLPASLLSYLAGSEVQEMLGVRSGGWGQYWANKVTSGRRLSRVALGRPTRLPGGELSAMMGREILQMFTEQGNLNVFDRNNPRDFELSDRLCRSWGIRLGPSSMRQRLQNRPG